MARLLCAHITHENSSVAFAIPTTTTSTIITTATTDATVTTTIAKTRVVSLDSSRCNVSLAYLLLTAIQPEVVSVQIATVSA